eukprot:5225782-Prymnesium_polylepis.1
MEVEAQVAQFLRFSPAVLWSAARGARSNSCIRQVAARSLVAPDSQCAHLRAKGGYGTVKIDVTQTPDQQGPTTAIPVRARE